MRADTSMRYIPTIVFTNSDVQETIQDYNDGGNSFISKPIDLDRYETIAQCIADFWFCTATKPAS